MQGVTRSILWLSFFAAILAAWWVMFSMAQMMGVDWIGRPIGMMQMGETTSMGGSMQGGMSGDVSMMRMDTFATLFPMWAIMMAAMMLPTMVPTLRSYEDLMASANGSRAGWVGVLVGYFVVWVGFAALIALAQLGLMATGLIDSMGIPNTIWFAAV